MRKIYLKKYELLCAFLLISVCAFAQTGGVRGKVVDAANQFLPGASVTITGTTVGSIADANGDFTIAHLKPGIYSITASYLGYVAQKKTITIADAVITINFSLQAQHTDLNEIVVVGYGSQRKSDLTGSVVAVSAKDFNQGPVTTPEALITGKVSGVEITPNGGEPGSGSNIRIRGGASLTASNDPLIVIDDVPVSNTGIAGIANPLSMINPNDIALITVLKDASSTAIYGSRASNGVIIITTKKGKGSDKLKINFSSINSLSKITKEYPVLSAAQFRNVVQTQDPDQASLLGNANTNWQNEIYRTAFTSDNNISFTGGVKGLPYRLSIGYLDQDGTLKTDNVKRTTVALNVNHDFFNKSLKADLNLKGIYNDTHFANYGAIGSAVGYDPTQPVYSGNSKYGGYYEWLDSSGDPLALGPFNPLGLLNEQLNRGTAKRGIGNLTLNYTFPFLKELQANATFGGDISDGQGHFLDPATSAADFLHNGLYFNYSSKTYSYNADYYLKYSKELKSINSHFDVQAGYSYQYFNFSVPGIQQREADRVTLYGAATLDFNGQYYIESPFSRLNFNVANKYLLTASIRDDRSSRFGPSNRNGYFPSVALAWRIKEESFLKTVDVLSDLKLRASYGITGQQDLGSGKIAFYFPYLAVYEPSDQGAAYQFGNTFTTTLRPDAYNADLKWETTATTNIGLDYGFLNGKISGSFDYYYKKTSNLLIDTPIPDGTNLTNHINANIGTLVTKGVDFNINTIAITTKDINWTIGYNISYNNVRVVNISLTKDPNLILQTGYFNGLGATIQAFKAGYTPSAFYVFKQIYKNGEPVEGMYTDINKNGDSSDDRYLDKQPNPSVFMGLSSSFSYKKWNLSFTMRSDLGNSVYNGVAAGAAYADIKSPASLSNVPASVLKTNFQNPQLYSDYFIQNASFLRMDNIALGYNFGKINKVGTLRASFNVQNVFIITSYPGIDPEIPGGIDATIYARPRVYSIGLSLDY